MNRAIHRITTLFVLAGLAPFCAANSAEHAPPSPGLGLLQITLGLLVVLTLMAGAAWLLKRVGPVGNGNKLPVKVVGGVHLGQRERVIVVEVADQWLVVGVTPGQINTLYNLPKQETFLQSGEPIPATGQFSDWLKRTIEKRTAAK